MAYKTRLRAIPSSRVTAVARAASVLTVLLGLWLIALVPVYSMFERTDAAEKVTDGFRDVVSPSGLDLLERDYGAIRALGVQYIQQGRPLIARQLGMTVPQYDALSARNFPAITRAVRELPPAVALVDPVVPRLRAIETDYHTIDGILGLGLPATVLPWLLIGVGGVAVAIGVLGLRSPGRGAVGAALVLTTAIVGVAFAFALPAKFQAAHRTVVVGRVALSQKAADTAARTVANVDAMVGEVNGKLIPFLAGRLHRTPAQVRASLGAALPEVGRGLREWPAVEPRAAALAKAQGELVDDFAKGDGAPFRTLPWLVIGPSLLVLLMAEIALLAPGARVRA